MNAPVRRIEAASEKREERRRIDTLSRMRATLHALGLELGRIQTLGNAEREMALLGFRTRLAQVDINAQSLERESGALAVADAAAPAVEG